MTRTEARDVAHLLDRMRACPTKRHALEILDDAEELLSLLPPAERDGAYRHAHVIIELLHDED